MHLYNISDLFLLQCFLMSEMKGVRKRIVGEGKASSNLHSDIAQIQAVVTSPEVLFSNRSCQWLFSKGRKEWGWWRLMRKKVINLVHGDIDLYGITPTFCALGWTWRTKEDLDQGRAETGSETQDDGSSSILSVFPGKHAHKKNYNKFNSLLHFTWIFVILKFVDLAFSWKPQIQNVINAGFQDMQNPSRQKVSSSKIDKIGVYLQD